MNCRVTLEAVACSNALGQKSCVQVLEFYVEPISQIIRNEKSSDIFDLYSHSPSSWRAGSKRDQLRCTTASSPHHLDKDGRSEGRAMPSDSLSSPWVACPESFVVDRWRSSQWDCSQYQDMNDDGAMKGWGAVDERRAMHTGGERQSVGG